MKKIIFITGVCAFILGLGMSACQSKGSVKSSTDSAGIATVDNSKNSLDWEGVYTGIVPCADCPGIFTQITLKNDNTYNLQREYLGKKDALAESIDGSFQWNKVGNTITLSGLKEKSMPSDYQVGENKLIQLDMEGKGITGDLADKYDLFKVNENLIEKKWKLIELKGVDLSTKMSNPALQAFIIFHAKGNRVNGKNGCNNFTGTYQVDSGSGLHFSGIASTRMMCVDMTVEDQMNKLFQAVDNYTVQNDTLNLNQAETILARFVPDSKE
jgi:heat shock protein HslJ